ncbi:uncharacterized protein LOC115954311 [Quercus lobata]|uniref:uncharacterized protein LOC115954311 n=1 Tax=Quercus lobata TaxID=97700 RepID=UPI001248A25C|nr:uncharacterized protein LOC115954311 [Quercus lobata]
MAVWVRLPELPIEFYDASVLKEIGSVIGPVLRIDSYMALETRGGYARLCVQLDLDKTLINSIRVGRLVQKVLHEGISSLCFCCGKLGHKQDNCGLKVRKPSGEDEAQVSLKSNEISEEVQPESNYGAWMVVMGLPSDDLSKSNQRDSVDSREGISRIVAAQNLRNGLADLTDEIAHAVATQNPEINLEMRKDCVMEECIKNPYAECQQDMKQTSGNKRKALAKNKGKGSEGLGIRS